MALDLAAAAVLRHYPLLRAEAAVPLGNYGGFSGAALWGVGEALCLRAWPEDGPTPDRLRAIHGLTEAARGEGLEFVPAVCRTRDGQTHVGHAGRLWDLTAWLPGKANFHDRPSPQRLQAACTALARLHAAWAKTPCPAGPCPAVRRRLELARDWVKLVDAGWSPDFTDDRDPVTPWARRAWDVVRVRLRELPGRLTGWSAVPLPLQPCLCDVWHAHVLFVGDAVTGLVDYGSVKVDHIATDLARLLGSLVPDDRDRTAAGLDAYARLRPLADRERALVTVLDETGALVGAANWVKWLYHDGRRFADRVAVAGRLAQLVGRIERWAQQSERRALGPPLAGSAD